MIKNWKGGDESGDESSGGESGDESDKSNHD